MVKHFTVALAALTLLASGAANAQVPSYAQAAVNDDVEIRGRIVNFDGGYAVTIRDERGFLDNVRLHQGTIINPTGITLTPGMIVSVIGYNTGPYLDANEVDTPYVFNGGTPYYGSHPWNYYGPEVGLGFFFGNVGWWHGGYFRGGYHYDGGARVYHDVHVNNVYHVGGGTYHGRAYVAPPERGGYYARSNGEQGHAGHGHGDGGQGHAGHEDRGQAHAGQGDPQVHEWPGSGAHGR